MSTDEHQGIVRHPGWQVLLAVTAICGFIVVKHRQNIGRLLAGTESRFGSSKSAKPQSEDQA